MAPIEFPQGQSRVVAGRYPPPGTDPHADAIRERRGARGITPLDANLLHVPPIAGGFNSLLGAVRTKGKLPGDLREVMILRVAAINHAAFEWIHHEIVGRKEGLSTGQLYVIRDVDTPLPPLPTILTPLQTAAIAFSDHSTRGVKIPMEVIQEFKKRIKSWVLNANPSMDAAEVDAKVDDLYVEAAMVVASYNLVSRFLLATDVAGLSDTEVPWPVNRKEHSISLPSFPPTATPTHTIHAITLITSPSAPWLVFANSLLTDWTMWNYIVPYFLDLPSNLTSADSTSSTEQKTTYNILLHSQRGHGLSTLPSSPPTSTNETIPRLTTIPLLAHDIANLIDKLDIPTPVHSVIGVSQGGATALAFGSLYGTNSDDGRQAKTKSIVACDTAPRTPAGNKEAWEERIRLVYGSASAAGANELEHAQYIGMRKLAKATVPRWFPSGSLLSTDLGSPEGQTRAQWVEAMVERTKVEGFVHGARALGEYDLIDTSANGNERNGLFESNIEKGLLLAGTLDGGGKVAQGLQTLLMNWVTSIEQRRAAGAGSNLTVRTSVSFSEIGGAGHLPMIDAPEAFCQSLSAWLKAI